MLLPGQKIKVKFHGKIYQTYENATISPQERLIYIHNPEEDVKIKKIVPFENILEIELL